MFEKYRFTEDSFGSECPDNWEEIADYLNDKLKETFTELDKNNAEDHEYSCERDEIWEQYCCGIFSDIPADIF